MSEDDAIQSGETLHLLRSATFDWAHQLGERLEAAGIPHDVRVVGERRSTDAQWAVYVREPDLPPAREVDRELLRELMPDLPEGFDPNAQSTDACPACAEPVGEGATECPSCGLALL